MASYNDGDGVWRTISGRRVFIRSGQSISSAMKASGKFKKAGKSKTKMQEIAVKGAPEKDLKEQYKQSLNEVSKMEYDGKINKDEYEKAVKNINDNYINKRNEYNGTDTKNSGNKSNEVKLTEKDLRDDYMLLDRLRQDNDYYLGNGGRAKKHLWAGDEKAQINKMREIYSKFDDDTKPEWLTEKDIDNYAKKMGVETSKKSTNDIMNEKIRNKREFTGYQAYLRDRYGTENEDVVSAGYKNKKDLYQEYKNEVTRRINQKRMEKGITSLEQAYRKAFQEYKKEHPNTKMNLQRFIKMSEE